MTSKASRPQRMQVSMKVLVKGVDRAGKPFDLSVGSENLSRGGLMFRAEQDIAVGAELDIVIQRPPLGPREFPPFFTRGKVVRAGPLPEGPGYDVAVQFIGPQLRTYVGETG